MKTIIYTATLLISMLVNSQTAYEKGMTKAFALWGEQKTDESINLFERIAKAEKENWLPYYYAAQVHIITSFRIKGIDAVEPKLKKAQEYLNEAKTLSKNNAEILVLEAMLNTSYVAHDPAVYGPTLSAKVEELYQKAKAIEPKNPRATLYHAEWQMGGAKYWGKDPKAFCPEIEKAILYFENDKHDTPFYPKWGKDRISQVQATCKE
ncbi:hypothetical protein [Aquimarina algicola]|uniref:Sel1 repeat family protein n=1 Tax=Aquimarina algicola TaxID=2589995 RepID=A0A504J9H6_9FLAO|nr:hypothetical protein [Aquimarina algicola]TPN85162.1 hypothetical protein FHK87_14115 [Aquimarina algicola]